MDSFPRASVAIPLLLASSPTLVSEVMVDAQNYCVFKMADSAPRAVHARSAALSSFYVACLKGISGPEWCACVDDEVTRFGVADSDLDRLVNSTRDGELSLALRDWADDAYPDLQFRVSSCSAGRSKYEIDDVKIAARRSITDPMAAMYCTQQLTFAANACALPKPGKRVYDDQIRRCDGYVERFPDNKKCNAVSTEDVVAYTTANIDLLQPCAYWGIDIGQFGSQLAKSGCPFVNSSGRLQLYAAPVPEIILFFAMDAVDGLQILSGRVDHRDKRYAWRTERNYEQFRRVYYIAGRAGGQDYTIVILNTSKDRRYGGGMGNPQKSDLELLAVDKTDSKK